MRVTVTGATGLIGTKLVAALSGRGDEVTVLSRDPERARARLGASVRAVAWDPESGPAPHEGAGGPRRRRPSRRRAGRPALDGRGRARIRDSRATGTRNLVAGLAAVEPRPRVLVSASAVGYYGPHGDEQVDEATPPGSDFLAGVCIVWEREAVAAEELGLRVARIRTGVVLDPDGGALAKMLPPFKLGAGGPVAGGKQYMPWIDADDLVGLYLAALDGDDWSGPINGTRAGAGHERRLLEGARASAPPTGGRAGAAAGAEAALRRDGADRHDRPAGRAATGARARLRLAARRPRRGAAQRRQLSRPLSSRRAATRRTAVCRSRRGRRRTAALTCRRRAGSRSRRGPSPPV